MKGILSMRVAIIGAGIVGIAAAHRVLDEGHDVALFDPRGLAEGASRGNAGWIAHLDVLPLASAKAWRKAPLWLLDPLGPLSIRPAHLPRFAPWLARFAAASRPGRVRSGMSALAALNRLALPAWEGLLGRLGLSHHLRRCGYLTVWDGEAGVAAARPALDFQRGLGIEVEVLRSAELRALEPAFGRGATAAFYPAGCHVGDPHRLALALGRAALGRGATLERQAVLSLTPQNAGIALVRENGGSILFDAAIVAAGAWSRPLTALLGDRVPLDTERGYNVTLPPGRLGLSRPVAFEEHGFVTTPLDGGDRVGGAVEFGGLEAAPNFGRVDAILRRLQAFLPGADLSGGTRWMGFRPSLPDSLPVIGPTRRDRRIVYAFGHGHYGLTQAAATADIMAALLFGRAPDLDPTPFSPQRF